MNRIWYLLIFIAALFSLPLLNASTLPDSSYGQSIETTIIRNIGHLVLLSSGDTLSRVMPVKKMQDGAYKISFEQAFLPNTDSLILISMKQLQGFGQYVMELWETNTNSLIYSFVVSDNSSENILPCLERPLPKTNYEIIIRFESANSGRNYFLSGGIAMLLLTAGLVFYKSRSPKPALAETLPFDKPAASFILLGATQFYPEQQKIVLGTTETALTAKEAQVLALLAETPDIVVERGRLQKEIWENQGIIVTRSLDVFISRLRKKLSTDSEVKIVNVHGKGYKLEIGGAGENGVSVG
jgi:hypothetical protein